MGLIPKRKTTTKKATPKAPVAKSANAKIKDEYNKGANYADLSEKHKLTVEEVATIVGA